MSKQKITSFDGLKNKLKSIVTDSFEGKYNDSKLRDGESPIKYITFDLNHHRDKNYIVKYLEIQNNFVLEIYKNRFSCDKLRVVVCESSNPQFIYNVVKDFKECEQCEVEDE